MMIFDRTLGLWIWGLVLGGIALAMALWSMFGPDGWVF